MKALLIAACALVSFGCGPPEPDQDSNGVGVAEQALDAPPVSMDELPAPLQALINEVAKGQPDLSLDPVEDRFFQVVNVTQTPPPTPLPPCPSCR